MNIGMGGFGMNSVNTHNTISMMSSMTGVPTRHAVSNNKEQGQADKLQNQSGIDSDGDSGEVSEEQETRSSKSKANARASQSNQSQAKQQATSAQQRRVSDAQQQKTQEKDGISAEKSDSAGQANKANKPSPTTFDTSRAIQLKFTKEQQQSQTETPKRPDVARKEFAENLKKWVSLEYKQYTKDVSLYTCRDMRSIMSALTDTSSKTNKTSSKEDKTGRNQVTFSSFNRYNISNAANALRIFEEIPSPEDNVSFDLVA